MTHGTQTSIAQGYEELYFDNSGYLAVNRRLHIIAEKGENNCRICHSFLVTVKINSNDEV